MSRLSEATDAARRALELARERDYAEGEAQALTQLSLAAGDGGDEETALRHAGTPRWSTGRAYPTGWRAARPWY